MHRFLEKSRNTETIGTRVSRTAGKGCIDRRIRIFREVKVTHIIVYNIYLPTGNVPYPRSTAPRVNLNIIMKFE